MTSGNGNQSTVGSDVIAALFGVTARRVQQLTKDGIIIAVKQKGANTYEMLPTIQRYIKYLSEKANAKADRADKEVEDRRLKAEADLKESRARMSQLQLRELEGKMHRSEDVAAVMDDLAFSIRGMMMALPGRLAADTSGAKTAAEASEVIRLEVNALLRQLAAYQYDPEEYRKRVREREGWENQSGGETGE